MAGMTNVWFDRDPCAREVREPEVRVEPVA